MPVVINGTTGIVSPKVNALDLELDSKNVVERGGNANGSYVRFADGTQICWRILTATAAINQAFYGGFRSAPATLALPAGFVEPPTVTTNAAGGSGYGSGLRDTSVGSVEVFFTSVASVASSTCYMTVQAIGRWY